MEDNLLNSLFSSKPLIINEKETAKTEFKEFRPSYKNGQNDSYQAVIRFLPNPEDPQKKSIVSKWTVFLKDPITNSGKSIDDPKSKSEDTPSPLSEMYFNLKNSPVAAAKKLSDNWKRHSQYYSLVQVIEDKYEPQLVNKILVWRYGLKVHEKICNEMKSPMDGVPGGNPFDLFEGRLFQVNVVNVSNYNNFDNSQFLHDIPSPKNCMRIPYKDKDGKQQIIYADRSLAMKTKEHDNFDGQAYITKFLVDNAPKLSKYEYKEWDEATKKYVMDEISIAQRVLSGQPITSTQHIAGISAMSSYQNQNSQIPFPASPIPSMPSSVTPSNLNDLYKTEAIPHGISEQVISGQGMGINNPQQPAHLQTQPAGNSLSGPAVFKTAQTGPQILNQIPHTPSPLQSAPISTGIDPNTLNEINQGLNPQQQSQAKPTVDAAKTPPSAAEMDEILNHLTI